MTKQDVEAVKNQVNQVMLWISTVTAAIAVAGVGYVFSELNGHATRLTEIETSRYTVFDRNADQKELDARFERLRDQMEVLRDRVQDLERSK